MPHKPTANKISKGRKPKPAANNIKDVDKSRVVGTLKNMQKKLAVVRNRLPVGPNANNAVFNRGNMMGGNTAKGMGVSGALIGAATPLARKAGTALGTKLGVALRPVGRAIDRTFGIKPKKKTKK